MKSNELNAENQIFDSTSFVRASLSYDSTLQEQ